MYWRWCVQFHRHHRRLVQCAVLRDGPYLIHDEGTPARDFFRSFKQNFVQATGLWLLFLAAGAALGFAFVYYLTTQMTGGMVLLMLSSLVLLLWGLMLTWVFPLQAKFTNTFWKTLNNAAAAQRGLSAENPCGPGGQFDSGAAVSVLSAALYHGGEILWFALWLPWPPGST